MGPFPNPSMSKARYVLTFIDDCTRYTWVYFSKFKSEVFENLKIFKAHVENQLGKMIKILHTDNGGEYVETMMFNIFVMKEEYSCRRQFLTLCNRMG